MIKLPLNSKQKKQLKLHDFKTPFTIMETKDPVDNSLGFGIDWNTRSEKLCFKNAKDFNAFKQELRDFGYVDPTQKGKGKTCS